MIEQGLDLSEQDLARIAELHVRSIDDSIPTMLGARYARAFFRYLARAPFEHLFVERVHGRIESVCVVSMAPDTVYLRTLRATLPQLALGAALALFRSGKFRRFLVRFVADLLRGTAGQPHAPEITYIFTNPDRRSCGIGRSLVRRVDEFLAERGVPTYYVRTIDETWNRALGFYDAQGFLRIGRQQEGGRPFAVFEKSLAGSLATAA
jgi:ribosomal protein S18 acetylase RimI-like enzyme